MALLLTGLAMFVARQNGASGRGARPPVQLTDFTDSVVMPSLSHDGRMLTFIRGVDFGRTAPTQGRVYVKLLPEGDPVELTSGEGGGYPPSVLTIPESCTRRWSKAAGIRGTFRCSVARRSRSCRMHPGWRGWTSSGLVYSPDQVGNAHGRRDVGSQSRRLERDCTSRPAPAEGAPVHALAGRSLLARGGNGPIRMAAVPAPPRRRILRGPIGGTATRTVHQRRLVRRWPMDVPSRRTPAVRSTSGGSRIPMARPSRSPSARRSRKALPSPPMAVI